MRIIWYIVVISFIFEILSLSTGMGFGTKLAPILFLLGYHPFQVIPTILCVQVITGLVAGVFHHEFKNVHLSFSPLNTAGKLLLLLTFLGCFSIACSIFFVHVIIQPSTFIIELFVACLVI